MDDSWCDDERCLLLHAGEHNPFIETEIGKAADEMKARSAIDFKWDNGPDEDVDSLARAFESQISRERQDVANYLGSDSYVRLTHDEPVRVQLPPRMCVLRSSAGGGFRP